MHLLFDKRSLCVLAALAAAWAPAHANTSTAYASIAQFQFRLVDLDLNDGIDASITFGADTRSLYSQAGDRTQQLNGSGTSSIVTASGSAGGTLSDTTMAAHAGMQHAVPYDPTELNFANYGRRSTEFILSPNTELILTAVGKVEQQLDGLFYQSRSQIGMAGFLLSDDGTALAQQFGKNYELYSNSGSATVNLYGSLVSNATARKGQFSLSTTASLWGPVSAVPEPSTWAMLLAGTFVLGAAARRRKAAAAPAP